MDGSILNIESQLLHNSRRPLDPKKIVGPGQAFETIDELLLFSDLLTEGLLVEDTNYGIVWQLYLDGEVWKNQIYDGTFYVRVCDAVSAPILTDYYFEGLQTIDDVELEEDDNILVANSLPQLNGIWIVSEGRWTRHPIFNESIDNLVGVKFIVSEGFVYKNSQWEFTTKGDITPATLAQNASLLAGDEDDIALFNSYSYLTFELIGGKYVQFDSFTSPMNVTINRFNFFSVANCMQYSLTLTQEYFIASRPYTLTKVDESVNVLALNLSGVNDTFPPWHWVLTEQNDWVEYIALDDKGDNFMFKSNRINKAVTSFTGDSGAYPIDRNCRIDFDLPVGYRLYSITVVVITEGTDSATLSLGSTSLGHEFSEDVEYELGGAPPVTTIVNQTEIADVYVSGTWNECELYCSFLIVKEG